MSPLRWMVASCLLLGCAGKAATPPEAEAPRHVSATCAAVAEVPTRDTISLRGTLAPLPDKDMKVAAQVAGVLVSVDVREGDVVTAGQVVARLDDGPLVDAERAAQATLASASAERKNAQTSRARSEQVFEAGIAPRQEVDDAVARVASARATEEAARAALSTARRDRTRASVTSPLAGVVVRVFEKVGELVDGTAATPIVEVADLAQLELVVSASARDLIQIARGQTVAIDFPGGTTPYRGVVSALAPAVDPTTGFGTLRIALASGAGAMPPIGSYATASIAVGAERRGLFVPAGALRSPLSGKGEVVVCGADGVAHVRSVSLGVARAGQIEVSGEGIAGERVVVEPVLGVADGDHIDEAKTPEAE